MSQELLEEERLLKAAAEEAKAKKKNYTYFLNREVVEIFNEIVPDKKRGAMVEVLMKQFIQRHNATVHPISSVPRKLTGSEDEE